MLLTIQRDHRRELQQGFSLIEVLIVLGLIVGFMALIGPKIAEMAFGGSVSTTQIALKNIKQTLDFYKLHTNKYPEKLSDLYKRPADEKKWQGPYLDKEEDPRDAWDQKLQYKRTPNGKHPYELFSYGGEYGPETPAENRIDVWEI